MAGPTTAPMLTTPDPLAASPQDAAPPTAPEPGPQEDDVPEPPVPAEVLASAKLAATVPQIPEALMPLANGFCQYLQGRMHTFMTEEANRLIRGTNDTLVAMRDTAQGALQASGTAQDALTDVLATVAQGLTVNPYKATMKAVSPAGYLVSIEIVKTDPGELIESVEALHGVLKDMQYGAIPEIAAFD